MVKRLALERSSARLSECTTVAGSVSNIAAVRTVWRVSAVCEAASGPLPQTSPSTMPHVPSPSREDVVEVAADQLGAGVVVRAELEPRDRRQVRREQALLQRDGDLVALPQRDLARGDLAPGLRSSRALAIATAADDAMLSAAASASASNTPGSGCPKNSPPAILAVGERDRQRQVAADLARAEAVAFARERGIGGDVVAAHDAPEIGRREQPERGAGEVGRRVGRGLEDLVEVEPGDDRAADLLERRAAAALALGLLPREPLGLLQELLGTPALGQVAGDLREADERAVGVAQGGDDDVGPEQRAVLAHAPALLLEAADSRDATSSSYAGCLRPRASSV